MSSAPVAAKLDFKNRLFKNFSLGFAARLYYLATRFVLTPITLAYVTLDEYGIWAACFILISYMGMSSIGIANVYIRYVAEYSAKQEQKKINQLVSTGLAVTLLLCLVLTAILLTCLPRVVHLLKIPAALTHVASVLVLATAASFMLDLSFGVFSNILTGLQRIAEVNLVWVITVTLELVVTIVLLRRGHGIYSLAWAFGARYLVSTVMMAIYCFRVMPGLSVRLQYVERSNLKLFFGYGSVVQLSGLLGTFLYSIEKVIAGIFVGVQATGLFDIGEKLPVMGSQLASSMNSIFMPALSHMNTLNWKDELVKFYLKGARYMNMLSGTLLGFMACFAAPLLLLWMGPADKFKPAVLILVIFCVPYQTHILTGPGSAYHRGVGHPGREMIYPLLQLIFVVIFVAIGFAALGKTTIVIAIAVASAMVLSGLIYMAYTNRIMHVPQWAFWTQAFLPGVVPYGFGYAVARLATPLFAWAGVSRLKVAAVIGLSGSVYLVGVFAALYLLFCPWGEREYLRRQAIHTFSGLLRRQEA
jgi:O-antigen/teichoic acid export membrane protein